MKRPLVVVSVLAALGVAALLLTRPASITGRLRTIARGLGIAPGAGEGLEAQRQVALRFAPIFVQKRSTGREKDTASGAAYEDFFTRLSYDGEWNGYTNHNNLRHAATQKRDLRGFVYYAVQETDDYYYLHYSYFHPDDPKWLGPHENDMEGAMVVVRKTPGVSDPQAMDATSLVVVQAQAHNQFKYRTPVELCRGSGQGLDDVVCGGTGTPQNTHVVLVSQVGRGWPWSDGHGTEIPRRRNHYDGPSIVYVPGESPEVPDCPPCAKPTRYALLSVTGDRDGDGAPESDADGTGIPSNRGPWDRRHDPRIFAKSRAYDVAGRTYTWGHAMHGHSGCKANVPWGWYGRGENLPHGVFFLDPAGQHTFGPREILARYGVREPATPRYVSNVFLSNVVLPGTAPTSPATMECRCDIVEQTPVGLDALAVGPPCARIPKDRAVAPLEVSRRLQGPRPAWNTCEELAEWTPVGVEQSIERMGTTSAASCFVRLSPGALLTLPRRYPIEDPQELPPLVDPRRFSALRVVARTSEARADLGGFYLQAGREYDGSIADAPFFAPAPLGPEWRTVTLRFDRSARFVPGAEVSFMAVGRYVGRAFAGAGEGEDAAPATIEIDSIELVGAELVSRGVDDVARTAPTVTGIRPATATFGERVTLTGSGFAAPCELNEVRFGDLPLPVVGCSDTELIIEANAAGAHVLEVRSAGVAAARSPEPLRILAPAR